MENTPPGSVDDLLTFFQKIPRSRSVNNSLQQLDFDPNSMYIVVLVFLPAKAPPSKQRKERLVILHVAGAS